MSVPIVGMWIASVLLIVWALRSIAVAVRRVADVLFQASNPGPGVLDRLPDPQGGYDPNSLK